MNIHDTALGVLIYIHLNPLRLLWNTLIPLSIKIKHLHLVTVNINQYNKQYRDRTRYAFLNNNFISYLDILSDQLRIPLTLCYRIKVISQLINEVKT